MQYYSWYLVDRSSVTKSVNQYISTLNLWTADSLLFGLIFWSTHKIVHVIGIVDCRPHNSFGSNQDGRENISSRTYQLVNLGRKQ